MLESCDRDSIAPLSGMQRASNLARSRLCLAMQTLGWGDQKTGRYVRRSLQTVWRWRNGLTPIPADCLELLWDRAFGAPSPSAPVVQ